MDDKKHTIVTGATSGIGEVTAIELAKSGDKVIIIGRNEAKCQATVKKIVDETGQAVDYLLADFSSIESTKAAAQQYLDKYDRLDLLVNNAGALFGRRQESPDGLEMHIAVNHIGPFVLTMALLDLMKQTAEASGDEVRIVNVNSDAHYSGVNWEDIQYEGKYSAMKAYGQSKTMNLLFTKELAQKLEGSGVTVNALHPGVVGTNIFTGFGNNIFFRALGKIAGLFMLSPEDGAKTTLYLSQSADLNGVSGSYYADQKEKKPLSETLDEGNQTKMWEMTEAWVS
ncbi:MAG: SDR family oxidoreductase [Chloroflexota bacterium]